MKKMIRFIVVMLMINFASEISAQSTSFSGVVEDDQGEPLIGATIMVQEMMNTGTISDYDGSYSLSVEKSGPLTIEVSYTGFSTVTQAVEDGGVYDIVLSMDALGLDEIVVTGVVNSKSKLESSISITTLKPDAIAKSAPRTTAEIFRTIPGIRSEASGGDGNTNITVRGVPISAGGSKYLQLQEDGLPVFLFGDIAFATSDIFLRADNNVSRIEAIRGGSASTLSSNSPAGIINFISKNGGVEGGSIGSTFGLDYNSFRTDFDYGSPITDDLNFHIGGFFRSGEGPRSAGYNANNGGQIKANLTKHFENGYARVYIKHLNDRTAAYMPMPIQVSGTNDNPTWESIDGFSATQGTPHSVFLQSNFGLGADGERRNADITDGMRALSNAIGAEFKFDLGNDWTFESRSRMAQNSGRFIAPFPSTVGTAADMVDAVADATNRDLTGATLTYAHDQYYTILILYSLGIFSFGVIITLLFAMYTDCAEYGEYISGHNSAGLTVSASMFSLKFGSAVGSAIPGYLLAWYGFVKDQKQSIEALQGIDIMWNVIPAIFFMIAALLMFSYKLDGKTMLKIEQELLERRR